jgi:hypothetical protein
MDEAQRRAAGVALGMEPAGGTRTRISIKGPEKGKLRVFLDLLEGVREDISEQELFSAEEEVAGIDRTVGRSRLRLLPRTADRAGQIRRDIRRNPDRRPSRPYHSEPALNDRDEAIKGD